jgi:hypothetical protein
MTTTEVLNGTQFAQHYRKATEHVLDGLAQAGASQQDSIDAAIAEADLANAAAFGSQELALSADLFNLLNTLRQMGAFA